MSYPYRPNDPNEPISVVEDLDPEPPGRPGLSQRIELIVGLLLVVGVLSFVGWQWWHQQVQVSSYAAGQTALANVDWDDALSGFTQAGDYRDAPQQADHARRQVGTRNRLYTSAQQHAEAGEWLEALSDVRAAALIQPTYRDLPDMEQTTLQNVYTTALSGTVAMRIAATPPGLYYYDGRDWVYLQDSDERSSIMDTDGHGRLVYDVADPCRLPSAICPPANPSEPGTQNSGLAATRARYYQVAGMTPQGFTFARLDMDPEHYSQVIMNAQGAWGLGYGGSIDYIPQGPDNGINPVIRSNYVGMNMAYQPFDGPLQTVQTRQVFTESSGSNIIVAIDPVRDRYLTVDYTGAHSYTADSSTTIRLYMNEAGSTERQLIYTHSGGGIQSAQLSPGGRYALVNVAYFRENGAREKVVAILIDLRNEQADPNTGSALSAQHSALDSHVVQEVNTSWSVPIGSAFVPSGAFVGDIVIYEPDDTGIRLLIVDPSQVGTTDNPQGVIKDMTVENQTGRQWVIMNGHGTDGSLLMMGQADVSPSYPLSYTLSLINIPAQGQPAVTTVRMPANSYFGSIQLNGDSAAWVTDVYPTSGTSNVATTINVVTLGTHGSEVINPTVVFSSTYDPSANKVNTTPSISLGHKLIAYSLDKQLHVRNYTGSIDVVLESGLSYIINYRSEMTNPFWGLLR